MPLALCKLSESITNSAYSLSLSNQAGHRSSRAVQHSLRPAFGYDFAMHRKLGIMPIIDDTQFPFDLLDAAVHYNPNDCLFRRGTSKLTTETIFGNAREMMENGL